MSIRLDVGYGVPLVFREGWICKGCENLPFKQRIAFECGFDPKDFVNYTNPPMFSKKISPTVGFSSHLDRIANKFTSSRTINVNIEEDGIWKDSYLSTHDIQETIYFIGKGEYYFGNNSNSPSMLFKFQYFGDHNISCKTPQVIFRFYSIFGFLLCIFR